MHHRISYLGHLNKAMESYDTMVEAINALRQQGYTEDFNLMQAALFCSGKNLNLSHDEFVVDKFFRFEGQTDPADESILYAISAHPHEIKGILVSGFSSSSNDISPELLARLNVHP